MEFFPKPYPSSSGFTVVKKTACLPLLRLVPPGIYPFLIMEFNSFAFTTWRGAQQILSESVHCLATRDQQHSLLNVHELLEGTGIDWKSLDSRNIDISSSLLLLLPELIFNHQVTIAKRRRNCVSCILR